MSKRFFLLIGIGVALVALIVFLRGPSGTGVVWSISDSGTLMLPLVLISALLDSVHPCSFAILLVTIAVLLGLGAMRARMLAVGATYIAGIFAAYLSLGLGLLGALHFFAVPNFMGKLGAVLLIGWGLLSVINALVPAFPVKVQIPAAAHRTMAVLMQRASIPAAFGLGLLVGLCAFPCAGGPYVMVLGMLHDSATYLQGLGYLVLYNAVFVLPLVLVLLLVSDRAVLAKLDAWKKANIRGMRLWTGVAMVAFGVLILMLAL